MTRTAIIATLLVAAGCSGGREQAALPQDAGARTGKSRYTTPTVTPPTPPPPAPAPAVALAPTALGSLMTGAWDISPTGVFGPHLTITVDSARGPVFFGRLTRVVAGSDVLLDTDRFERFVGIIGPDSVARLTVTWKDKLSPPAEIAGKVSAGEWRLSRFVWGGEQQVVQNHIWTGRKAK
ncbi:MAG: hypothetical protein EXR93_01045 [Gemmatimonadetes bacterium]|nr:hypothetical protein [Gemmatimonadota bacterium]